jgi:hypothetical protein
MGQYIESANSYSLVGQKVTVSLKLKKLAGFDTGTSITISLFRLNSKDVASTTLDGPASGGATLIQQFTHTLTTSDWESVTFTTTSVLPSEAANGLLLHLNYSKTNMGASEKFAIAQVQLEPGTVATPFEVRPYGTELALCRDYTDVITGGIYTNAGIGAATGTTYFYPVLYGRSPRRAPTSISYTGTAWCARNGSVSISITSMAIDTGAGSVLGAPMLAVTVASGLTAGQFYNLGCNNGATTDKIIISAEL